MEQERNHIGCFNMEQPKWDNNMSNMPPYMYGKCMNMTMENFPCNNYLMPYMDDNMSNFYKRGDMYMNPYMMQKFEPIENMYGNTYKVLIVYVRKTMQNIMMENMGMMPKTISKEKLNKHINDMVCDMMKDEDKVMKMIMIERFETEDEQKEERSSCPSCKGLIKDTLTILLVTELLKSGCVSCY